MDIRYEGTGRLYDLRAWKRARNQQLATKPICAHCHERGVLTPANEVDHIVSIRQGGHPYDPDNLQSLCKPCHSRKTNKDDGAFGRATTGPVRGCNADGLPTDADHPWFAQGAFSEL